MKHLLSTALFLTVLGSRAFAQTASYTVSWDQPNTPADTATFVYTLTMDANLPVAVPSPACAAVGTGTHCTAPFPLALRPLLTSGKHDFILTASIGTASASSDPYSFSPPVAPGKPTTFQITFTITVP